MEGAAPGVARFVEILAKVGHDLPRAVLGVKHAGPATPRRLGSAAPGPRGGSSWPP